MMVHLAMILCPLSILTIGKESLAEPLTERIRELNTDCTIDTTESAQQALIFLEKNIYDLVICQCSGGDLFGAELVEKIQEKKGDIPLIVIAQKANEHCLLHALYRGLECTVLPASDYAYTAERIQQKIDSIRRNKREREAFETYKIQSSGIITHIPNPTFAIDLEGRVIVWNKAMENFTGVPAADILGKGMYEYAIPFYGKRRPVLIDQVIIPDAECESDYHNIIRTDHVIFIQSMPLDMNGRTYFVQLHASPIYDNSGKMTGAVESITDITALKHGEDALIKSEAKFRGITERVSDLIVSMDSHGVIVYVSPSVKTILGYEPEFLRGKIPTELLLSEDLGPIHYHLERLREGKQIKWVELRFRKKDGTYAILGMSGTPIQENNIITGIQVIARDITAEKVAEEHIFRLLDEQKELLGIIDKSPAVVFIRKAGKSWQVERVTENVSQFGYTAEDFLSGNMTFSSIIHPDDREEVLAGILYKSAHHVDDFVLGYRIIGKDTTAHWVEDFTHIRRDATGEASHYQGIIIDITERKAAEEALHESRAHYQQLFESSPISLWEEDFSQVKQSIDELKAAGITDFRRYFDENPKEVVRFAGMVIVQDVNNATLHLLEAHDRDELRANLQKLLTDESENVLREKLITLAQGGLRYTGETSYKTLSGKKISTLFQMAVAPGSEETLDRIIVSLMDITDRKRAEATVQEVNKKLNLLGSITRHDILNQLTLVQGYMEILNLAEFFPPESHEQKFVTGMSGALDTIEQQINFAGDYQNLGEQAPEWYPVGRIIEENRSNHGFQAIHVAHDLKDLEIYDDPLFTKVIYNLFDNAVKHGEKVTKINFSCVRGKSPTTVDLIYEDDGVGIPDGVKDKIFNRKYYKNTGLGLFLSRDILSITGLSIEENGVPGEGARFVIHIPQGLFRFGE